MHEHHDLSAHTQPAVLDIGAELGALVIYTAPALHGHEIEVQPRGAEGPRTHTAVLERHANGRLIYAALFLALPVGDYVIRDAKPEQASQVTITSGAIAEIDWR